jgi:glycosyltransferase involved in cell wall biosynthesis
MNLVAPSTWMAECAQRSALMQSWPIRVIPNPIDPVCWAPVDQQQARTLLNLPPHASLILFGATGGVADARKGGDLLLKALQLLPDLELEHPGQPIELVVFGQSDPDPGFVPSLPIHYRGRISDELHLRLLYAAADVFVIPSRQDNLPNTGLEAHACGTPVVAFRTGGLTDIVDHGVTGALAEPFQPASLAQAIHWVLADRQRRRALGEAARRRALELWAPQRVASLYANLYREVLEHHPQP